MDELVQAALRKWPNVPHCFGWLGLDARGDWFMRDDATQAAGPFPVAKGSRIEHDKLRAFIERNYQADDTGCWYFQNGPQRVYVTLEATPWVWRLLAPSGAGTVGPACRAAPGQNTGACADPLPQVRSHTGLPVARVDSAWMDERGRLFLATELGLGLVHSLDMDLAADAVLAGHWAPEASTFVALQGRFRWVMTPSPT